MALASRADYTPRMLRLAAVAEGDRGAATARVRDAFSAADAWITDVHFFSGVQTVFVFETASDRIERLRDALADGAITLNDASLEALEGARTPARGEVTGTLAVTFMDGELDLAHEVPRIPG